ncbi:MAG: hypothetical protein F4Z04_04715 [Acidobacteria bacterium]|nr:hypothetical protein [Acidobacteriota bacterium]
MPPNSRQLAFFELLKWLQSAELTASAPGYDRDYGQIGLLDPTDQQLLGRPSHRAKSKTRAELRQLREQFKSIDTVPRGEWAAIWAELRDPREAVRQLDIARLPADAIAFYRPFHLEPVDQWGIYILVDDLMRYLQGLKKSLGTLATFPEEILATAVIFDVFHHEFFHHLVECAATAIEVVWPAPQRRPVPIYLNYRRRTWRGSLEEHEHDPLEEALANAYAYNSFSFITRVRGEYLHGVSRLYQRALEKSWPKEPQGYREAGAYVQGRQLVGARLLLQRMLATEGTCSKLPVGILADAVFPRGHAAFWQKPDIPTYLVGSPWELAAFESLIPAPNEAYCALSWPGQTGLLDSYLKDERRKEREAKRKARGKRPEQR